MALKIQSGEFVMFVSFLVLQFRRFECVQAKAATRVPGEHDFTHTHIYDSPPPTIHFHFPFFHAQQCLLKISDNLKIIKSGGGKNGRKYL
jgi:hypothetical protein